MNPIIQEILIKIGLPIICMIAVYFLNMLRNKIKEKNSLLKKGLGAASYYFLILWAKENSIKQIDFGTSRAFLNDGVSRFKRKWGTTIKKTKSITPSVFAFKACNNSQIAQNFKMNNPFVYLEKNQLKIMPQKKSMNLNP